MTVQLRWNGQAIDAVEEAVEKGLEAGADLLLDESNRKAPIETGDLIRSGTARAEGAEAAVGYSSKYATAQHERLDFRHDAGREAKFLENAMRNNQSEIADTIADAIREALR